MRIALILALAACGKGGGDKTAPRGTVDKLELAIGDERLAVDRAFVKRVSPDVYTLLIGAGTGSCESLLAGTQEGSGTTVSFSIMRQLAGGTLTPQIRDVWSRDADLGIANPFPAVAIGFEGNADAGTEVKIDFKTFPSAKLRVAGTLTAVGCGERPPSGMGVPKAEHPSKASIMLGDRQLAVRGVTVSTRAGVEATDLPNITISTSPLDCSNVTLPAQVIVDRRDGKWTLRGTWFASPIEATGDVSLTFSANDVGKGPDGPTLKLELSGSGVFGTHVVRLVGKAEAIECVR